MLSSMQKKTYNQCNLDYKQGDIRHIPIGGQKLFDVIICFEALEHVEEQEQLLSEIKRLLKDEGLLIISTPNKKIHGDEENFVNPFHKKELEFIEFQQLLKQFFPNIIFYGQKISSGSYIYDLTPTKKSVVLDYYLKKEDESYTFTDENTPPRIFLAVASEKGLEDILTTRSFCIDTSDSILEQKKNEIYTTFTYCYINTGGGFSEDCVISKIINAKPCETPFNIHFDLRPFPKVKSLRWNPIKGHIQSIIINNIKIEIKNGEFKNIDPVLLESNANRILYNEFSFNSTDPWILIPVEEPINGITISGNWSFKDLREIVIQQEQQIINLSKELTDLKQSNRWGILMNLHNKFVNRILPSSTRRRVIFNLSKSGYKCMKDNGIRITWEIFLQWFFTTGLKGINYNRIINNYYIPDQKIGEWKKLPNVTIIIVTYNSGEIIKDALNSILQSHYPQHLLETIIIDNNSTDNIKKIIDDFNQQNISGVNIKLIQNNENYGFGNGVNIGAHSASIDSEFLLLMNPDSRLFEDTIHHLVSSALSSQSYGFRMWECRQLPYEHPKYYNPVTLETTWSSAACCLIDRKAFEAIKGFDENIFLYLEDVDLSWRLRMAGYRLRYVPSARVLHNSYNEPGKTKIIMFKYSILYNFYLRYKFGSLRDIIQMYRLFLFLFFLPPKDISNVRKIILIQYFKHFLLIPSSIVFRNKNKLKLNSFKPLFNSFNFELHRPGAFIKYCNEQNDITILPKVTIIVRTIGRKNYLNESLLCIRNQTYPNIEVIVIEDGPATVQDLLDSNFKDLQIKYIPLGANRGRSYAGNVGMQHSTGKYLRFLDEDDLLFAHSVETAVYFMLKNFGKFRLVYDLAFEVPTEIISDVPFQYIEHDYTVLYDENFDREKLLDHNYIPIQCALFDRSLKDMCGGFDECLDYLEDWDLWIRYSMKTDFLKIPLVTSLYRVPSDPIIGENRIKRFIGYNNKVRNKYLKLNPNNSCEE